MQPESLLKWSNYPITGYQAAEDVCPVPRRVNVLLKMIWHYYIPKLNNRMLISLPAGPGSGDNNIEKDNMGFTIQAMRLPLQDLGITVIKELRYYNTKRYPVITNEEYLKKVYKSGQEFAELV